MRPKEARYWRIQNDFLSKEKLPTEGGIKRTSFCSYSKDGIVYIGLIELNVVSSPSVNACSDMTILHGHNIIIHKKLKYLKDV